MNLLSLFFILFIATSGGTTPVEIADDPLPIIGERWHPGAGIDLHVSADTHTLFACSFEDGWFSNKPQVEAEIHEGIEFIDGPFGKALKPLRLAYPGKSLIDPDSTYFGFWFRPDFAPGGDSQRRILMQMGNGDRKSLVLGTNGAGELRLSLSDDDYATCCRADISSWKMGEWHHIAGWFHVQSHQLWLMLDGYGVDSSIMYHNEGLSAGDLGLLHLGCGPTGETPGAIDEVVFAKNIGPSMRRAHHDWMLGIAQLAARGMIEVSIKPSPWGVPCNRKAVAGTVRTFGLECTLPRSPRVIPEGITSDEDPSCSAPVWTVFNIPEHKGSGFNHAYGIGERIAWSSSDPEVADVKVVENKRLDRPVPVESGCFEIKKTGHCRIMARMGGREWNYDLEVVDRHRPDLLVQHISRYPRYGRSGIKNRPATGDRVEFEVHIANRGFEKSLPARVKLQIHESEGLHDLDSRGALIDEQITEIDPMAVHETTSIRFPWTWRTEPCHVTARIEGSQPEISLHNNERSFLTNRSRSVYLLVDPESWELWHDVDDHHAGTFALEDWLHAQSDAWNRLLRESVYPSTSPYGIQVRLHIETLIEMENDPYDWGKHKPGPYFDGGWICNKNWAPGVWASGIHYALMHEWGHGCFAGTDLYSLHVWKPWFHIRDDAGNEIEGTGACPEAAHHQSGTLLYRSSAMLPEGTNSRFLMPTMMQYCGPSLHEGFAGCIQHNFPFREQGIWQIHRRAVPLLQNMIVVRDIEGNPIPGAALAVWQQSHGVEQNSGRSLWPDSIKFAGRTDGEGKWIYPFSTARSFDDPGTDEVEGSVEVASILSTPRQVWPASPGVWSNNSMQLIGVRKGLWTEYHWLDSFQVGTECYRNDRLFGMYVLQTNIPVQPDDVETRAFRATPAQDPNSKPIVLVPEEVRCAPGKDSVIDASGSHDPEGKPVTVHWILGGWRQDFDIRKLGGKVDTDQGPVLNFTAPEKPCELRFRVYCCDSIRISDIKEVRIIVGEEDADPGS